MKMTEILARLNTLGIVLQALPNGNIRASKKIPDDLFTVLKDRKRELWVFLTDDPAGVFQSREIPPRG